MLRYWLSYQRYEGVHMSKVVNGTYIPSGIYVNKVQAAEYLDIPLGNLQYHIGKGNINTINFPGHGHLINELDVLEFEEKLKEIKPGRPSIYKKVR